MVPQQHQTTEPVAVKPDAPQGPTEWELFLIFVRIALTSFGGGVSGWMLREFVQDRGWLTKEEFLSGLALSQALPGVNVKNLAIWIGYRLLGRRGAAIALLGVIVPPACMAIVLTLVFSSLAGFDLTHAALSGAAAAAIGLSIAMGITAVGAVPRRIFPLGVMIFTFVAISILQWPLLWTALGVGMVSITWNYLRS